MASQRLVDLILLLAARLCSEKRGLQRPADEEDLRDELQALAAYPEQLRDVTGGIETCDFSWGEKSPSNPLERPCTPGPSMLNFRPHTTARCRLMWSPSPGAAAHSSSEDGAENCCIRGKGGLISTALGLFLFCFISFLRRTTFFACFSELSS